MPECITPPRQSAPVPPGLGKVRVLSRKDTVERAAHLDPLPAPSRERRARTQRFRVTGRWPGHGANEGSLSLCERVCVYRVSLPLRETKKKLLASEARLRQPRPRDGNSLLARPACGLGPTGPDSPVGGPAPAVESLAPVA